MGDHFVVLSISSFSSPLSSIAILDELYALLTSPTDIVSSINASRVTCLRLIEMSHGLLLEHQPFPQASPLHNVPT